jgi:hypothetical protein
VVLVIQGDPGFDFPETEDVDERLLPQSSGYRSFMAQVVKVTVDTGSDALFNIQPVIVRQP